MSAGAVIVGPSTEPGIGPSIWGSEGDKADVISQTVPWDAYRDGEVEKFPAIRQEGHQKNVIELMQSRAELYDRIGYHAFEQKLDALFAAKK